MDARESAGKVDVTGPRPPATATPPPGGFPDALREGRPNTLGRTVDVAQAVLADRDRLGELLDCYHDADEWVRLRASNALKRVCSEQPLWVVSWVDRLLDELPPLRQPSAQWTLAQLLRSLRPHLTQTHVARGTSVMEHHLRESEDWIVLNQKMRTLVSWAEHDAALADRLRLRLQVLTRDRRGSVSGNARRGLTTLTRT